MAPTKYIFLSASIPERKRLEKGLLEVDGLAVREAIIALSELLSDHQDYGLIWGGHPAITKLIHYIQCRKEEERHQVAICHFQEIILNDSSGTSDRFLLYQSEYFKPEFPMENKYFRIQLTKAGSSRHESLLIMRDEMLKPSHNLVLGVFMGGRKEGLKQEYELLKKNHPQISVLPLAKTGGYSEQLYHELANASGVANHLLELCGGYHFYELFERTFAAL